MARKKASEVEVVVVEDAEGDEEFNGGVEDANELNRYCQCGCGAVVRKAYLPGHDAKRKARLLNEASAGSVEAAEMLESLGWGRFLEVRRAKDAREAERRAKGTRCQRCRRVLTDSDSCEAGFGDTCLKHVKAEQAAD